MISTRLAFILVVISMPTAHGGCYCSGSEKIVCHSDVSYLDLAKVACRPFATNIEFNDAIVSCPFDFPPLPSVKVISPGRHPCSCFVQIRAQCLSSLSMSAHPGSLCSCSRYDMITCHPEKSISGHTRPAVIIGPAVGAIILIGLAVLTYWYRRYLLAWWQARPLTLRDEQPGDMQLGDLQRSLLDESDELLHTPPRHSDQQKEYKPVGLAGRGAENEAGRGAENEEDEWAQPKFGEENPFQPTENTDDPFHAHHLLSHSPATSTKYHLRSGRK